MQVFADSARAQLVSFTSNSLVVSSGARFPVANRDTSADSPSNAWFKVVIAYGTDYEICHVHTHTGNGTFTNVLRGQEGTTARTWPVDKQQTSVFIAPVASDMAGLLASIQALNDVTETVSQPEAEAGTGTTPRSWTAQRVRQAITAWWNSVRAAQTAFTNATPSTSTTSGAITIAGGLGVGGAIHAGSAPSWLSPDSQTAPMVFIKDAYRQQVEAASGGRQTVLYTAKGQPSVMNIIPAFNLQDIDPGLGTGVHPAFIVGGVQKSELFIGTHIGSVSENELISQPGVEPAHSRNHDQFVTLARACGAGWHVMTNAEWSAIALWSHKNGTMPRGNTNYGRSSDATYETARRMDLLEPGNTVGNPRTRTGSGPASWRHDHTMHGISDLCGNVWEWTPGMRIVNGEIHVIANNDAALIATDLAEGSTAWRAIDGATGNLVAPGHANAVKYAASGTAAYTLVHANWAIFEGMANPGSPPVSAAALQKLKAFGLFPVASSGLGGDTFGYDLTGERLPVRGGGWDNGAHAGVFVLYLGGPRSGAGTNVGARPAFVI